MKWYCGLAASGFLMFLAGCGDNQTTVATPTGPSVPASLTVDEKQDINDVRIEALAVGGGGSSNVVMNASANESAIFHSGYLASMTAGSQASAGGTIENKDSLPLATDTGSNTQDPENRLRVHSSGALPTNSDDVSEYYLEKADDYPDTDGYVPDDNGNPSRVLTMWYSRKGRQLLSRNQLNLFGFGSVADAQALDLRVPNPPNNTFLSGDFRGTFVLIFDTTKLRDRFLTWPAGPSQTTAIDAHQHSTDNDGTGCPISLSIENTISSLDVLALHKWDGSTFTWSGPAAAFNAYAASNVFAGTTVTNLTLNYIQDTSYFPSEMCFVPVTPLATGLYRLTHNGNSVITPDVVQYFTIIP